MSGERIKVETETQRQKVLEEGREGRREREGGQEENIISYKFTPKKFPLDF